FFSSHSARPDMLAGLLLLGSIALAQKYYLTTFSSSGRYYLWIGFAFVIISLGASIHLVLLLGGVTAFSIWLFKTYKSWRSLFNLVIGCALGLIFLVTLQYIASGHIVLLGPSGERAEFHDVVRDIPLLHPLSWSVQSSNIARRAVTLFQEAPLIGIFCQAACLLAIASIRNISLAKDEQFIAGSALVTVIIWLLLERFHPGYIIHILPLVTLASLIVISHWLKNIMPQPVFALAVIVTVFSVKDSVSAHNVGSQLTASNLKS